MSETRKIAAILVADVVGYSRLAGAAEDRTLSRLRGLRSDLIDPPSPRITGGSSSAPATGA
jgi:adenylate cyclase